MSMVINVEGKHWKVYLRREKTRCFICTGNHVTAKCAEGNKEELKYHSILHNT